MCKVQKQRNDEAAILIGLNTGNSIEFDIGINELVQDGPQNGNIVDEVRLDIFSFEEGYDDNGQDIILSKVESSDLPYLKEFVRQVKGKPSSSEKVLTKQCKAWILAPTEKR